MGFVALIFALLIEQGRPLPANNFIHRWVVSWADTVSANTDAGKQKHGLIGWLLATGAVVLATLLFQWFAAWLHPVALFCFYVLVLYLTLGFRQFSHAFTAIQLALAANDSDSARKELELWLAHSNIELPIESTTVPEICRVTIAHALIAAHRHVFGPLFWFILLPGAVGPVLYRVAQMLADRWRVQHPDDGFGRFAQRVYHLIDWVPVRLSAAGFAVVGNFEDSVFCWRGAIAANPALTQRELLLAAGGGALGVRLADPAMEAQWSSGEQGFDWQGAQASPGSLRSAVGLVWRSVVLWVALFAMLTMANWLGR